jgi:LPLT family lysophospholipid transporter-like MFS transporter
MTPASPPAPAHGATPAAPANGIHPPALSLPLLSLGMGALLLAQFLSALADNAVLIAAIAVAKNNGMPGLVPLLQEAFVFPFIALAPFAGPVADGFSKSRVMLLANLVKLAGATGMALGANPLLAYGLIGIGATMYSPAKYGILAQMFEPARLVRANGMLEGSTIVAILLGVLLGGWLADHSLAWAFGGVMACYAVATAANLLIPRLPAENPDANFRPGHMLRRFWTALRTLYADGDARFSLLGTSVFWGSGTTLRLVLFAWVPVALLLNDNQTPAKLMGVLSLGIVAGAVIAGLWVSLARVNRALLGGLLLGPMILVMAGVDTLGSAALVMAGIGLCGGLFVVPLNALLQERGHDSVGAGSALAVQNFSENLTMLLFVGAYSAVSAAGVAVVPTIIGFGLVLLLAVGGIGAVRLAR